MSDFDMLKSLKYFLVQVKVFFIIEIGNKNILLEYLGMYKIIVLLYIFRYMILTKNFWFKNIKYW